MLVLKTWGWYLLNTCKWCVAATTTILKSCSLVAMLFQWPSLSETLNVWYNLPYVWWLFLEKIVGKQCKHITIHLVLYRIYVSHPLHFYLHNRPFGETTHPSSSPQRNPTKTSENQRLRQWKNPFAWECDHPRSSKLPELHPWRSQDRRHLSHRSPKWRKSGSGEWVICRTWLQKNNPKYLTLWVYLPI